VKRGYPVMVFNQRSVEEILQMIRIVGGLVGRTQRAEALVAELERGLADVRGRAARLAMRPRVFFEEWDAPLISGIRWVEELVEIAGGAPVFPELRDAKLGKDRIVDPSEVARRAPEVIVASWCGKPVRKERIRARQGWLEVPAVQRGQIYEIKSALILQPGPAALTEGLRQLHAAIAAAAAASAAATSSSASETGN
jgi:iron complex transport system substrate-binding protein